MGKVTEIITLKDRSLTVICDIPFSEDKFIFQPQYCGVNKRDLQTVILWLAK
jgi:hypothetical protein